VVCPAYFPSGIAESERSRPAALSETRAKTGEDLERDEKMRRAVRSGRLSAADIANRVFEAVRDERFYVLTHPRILPAVEARMRDILEGRNPGNPL
jgi:hypothetical protein